MCSQKSTNAEKGTALVAAVIVLSLLTALGFAALSVADLNINIAANDRDTKRSFFHADSGANIGHEFLEESVFEVNSTFYGGKAEAWEKNQFNATEFPLTVYQNAAQGTYVRAGWFDKGALDGYSGISANGYKLQGKSSAYGTYTDFLIRSHRSGSRGSQAEVDLGWKHLHR